jgi:hypothetical protein
MKKKEESSPHQTSLSPTLNGRKLKFSSPSSAKRKAKVDNVPEQNGS